jgi:hypothetical protein
MFGITITPNGTPVYGGSQSKFNREIRLETINELLGIPSDVIVPDPDIMEKKKIYETVIGEISSSDNIIQSIKILRKYNYWGIIPTNKIVQLLKISNHENLKKQLDAEWENIPNKKFGLFIEYPELCDLITFSDINKMFGVVITIYFIIIYQLKIKSEQYKDSISIIEPKDYEILTNMNTNKLDQMYNEIIAEDDKLKMNHYDDLMQTIMNAIAEELADAREEILNNKKGFSFKEYKEFYDKYVLSEDIKEDVKEYTNYFDNYINETFFDIEKVLGGKIYSLLNK